MKPCLEAVGLSHESPKGRGRQGRSPLPDAEIRVRALRCGRHVVPLDRPRIMGVLNVTPDSFSDGGRFARRPDAIERAVAMVEEGADVIDIGGESTRPGAAPVSADEEIDRVLPVLDALARESRFDAVPLSIDTRKPAVMRAAIASGASMVNDVGALRAEGALDAVATADVAVCLMHMQGEPQTMQHAPIYTDVVAEVRAYLAARADACLRAGVGRDRIVLDPGFGFGKKRRHNLALLRRLDALADLGYPILCGLSRKNVIGEPSAREPAERVSASVAAALAAIARGALLVRVHDVRETADALEVWVAAMSDVSDEA
jgi:dihydropteroate synthase